MPELEERAPVLVGIARRRVVSIERNTHAQRRARLRQSRANRQRMVEVFGVVEAALGFGIVAKAVVPLRGRFELRAGGAQIPSCARPHAKRGEIAINLCDVCNVVCACERMIVAIVDIRFERQIDGTARIAHAPFDVGDLRAGSIQMRRSSSASANA